MLDDVWEQIEPYLAHFAESPSTVATLMALSLVALVVAALVPRRRLLVLLTGMSLAAVGGFTLAPARGWTTFQLNDDPMRAITTALDPSRSDFSSWVYADGPANVALFVPFGFTLALLIRRPVLAGIVGVLLSLAIESYQAATGTRVGVFADVVSNSLGMAIGAGAAAIILMARGLWRVGTRLAPGRSAT